MDTKPETINRNKDIENIETIDGAPVITAERVQPGVQEKPIKRKGLVVTIIVLSALLLVAVGTILYLLFARPAAAPAEETNQSATISQESVDAFLATIGERLLSLKTEYPESSTEITEREYGVSYWYDEGQYFVRAEVDSKGIWVRENDPSTEVGLSNTSFQDDANTITADIFTEANGFDRKAEDIYQSEKLACQTFSFSDSVYVACIPMANFVIAEAQELKPFVEAFQQSTGDTSTASFSVNPTINNKEGGYANAQVGISGIYPSGGAVQLYYKENDTWVYWQSVQSSLQCSDYDTVILRQSFEGVSCSREENGEFVEDVVRV